MLISIRPATLTWDNFFLTSRLIRTRPPIDADSQITADESKSEAVMSKLQYRAFTALAIVVGSLVGYGLAESLLWLRPACG